MTAVDYLDFDLEVEATPTPGTFTVSVLSSPRGEASATMTFPFGADALENVILKLGRTRSGVRAIGSPTQDVAKKFGSTLYDALFAGEVGTCFRRSLDEADASGKGLRLRLRLGNAPQLADVPWEYLYPSGLRQFLVLSTKTPVVRYLEQPRSVTPLQVAPPLQVLVVVASPTNLATLDVNNEVTKIRTTLGALEQRGQVQVTVVANATLAELRRTLRIGTFHVLHFIGHGGFDDSSGEGMLAFEDDNHLAHLVSGSTLATMIHDHSTLRLVLLNACEGARQSPADPLGGVAQALVVQGIPAVVAMQFEITDEAATVFSTEFYSAIADGYPIDAALAEARVAVFSDDNDVEWGTPVLYLRASDGRIFDVAGQSAGPSAVPGRAPATVPEGAGTRVVPVVVPPWPLPVPAEASATASGPLSAGSGPPEAPVSPGWSGGGAEERPPDSGASAGGGAGGVGGAGGGPPLGPGGRSGPPAPPPPRRSTLPWILVGAVVAVVVLALLAWPSIVAAVTGSTSTRTSPTQTPTAPSSPAQPTPTTPTPRRTVTMPTLPPVQPVAALRAVRVPSASPITIDGQTTDWQWSEVARANNRIAGKSTATGDIYLMWDDAALYLLAKVTDSSLKAPQPNNPVGVWRGDSVILELGPDKGGVPVSALARPTDAYYMFGLPGSTTGPTVGIIGPNSQGTSFDKPARDSSSLQVAFGTLGRDYVLEARIPWTATGLNGVGSGAVFAANVNVSERTRTSYDNLGMMSTNPQRTVGVRAHPAYWQQLELLP